jgi:hypothetical protein
MAELTRAIAVCRANGIEPVEAKELAALRDNADGARGVRDAHRELVAERDKLRADVARLTEEIGFWERSSVAALAARHGIPTPASEKKV